jgi:hypothetical protein
MPVAPNACAASQNVDFTAFSEEQVEPTLNKRIYSLIVKTADYIVYLDDELYVEWSCNLGTDMVDGNDAVLNRVSMLEAIPVDHLTEQQVFSFRRMVAEGVARLFDKESSSESAMAALNVAEAWVTARNHEVARLWYLIASGVAAGIVGVVCVLLWLFRNLARAYLSADAFDVAMGGTLGGVGALLSVMQRSRSLDLEPAAGKVLHYMEGAARIIVGSIGAVLMALAFKGDLVLGFASSHEKAPVLLAVISLIAGASERFVPSFIERIEIAPAETLKE